MGGDSHELGDYFFESGLRVSRQLPRFSNPQRGATEGRAATSQVGLSLGQLLPTVGVVHFVFRSKLEISYRLSNRLTRREEAGFKPPATSSTDSPVCDRTVPTSQVWRFPKLKSLMLQALLVDGDSQAGSRGNRQDRSIQPRLLYEDL